MQTRHKIIFALLVGLNLNLISQAKIDSLKSDIKTGLQNFIIASKKDDNLKYINYYFLEQLIIKIDPKTTPKLYQLESLNNLNLYLTINAADSSFSYEYYSLDCNEHFYKNCGPKSFENKGENGLIYGAAGALDLVSFDTISNVILTRPTQRRYEVYRSRCPGGHSKEDATKIFMDGILGQYQLVIYLNKVLPRAYFVAPPSPSNQFNLRHTSGNF